MKMKVTILLWLVLLQTFAEDPYPRELYIHQFPVKEVDVIFDAVKVKVTIDRSFDDFKHVIFRVQGVVTPEVGNNKQDLTGRMVARTMQMVNTK